MGKYEPLGIYLAESEADEVPMTFRQIEALISAPLPPAAARHRAWWSNNPDNSAITRSWRSAGYRAFQVDMLAGTLVFRRDPALASPLPPSLAASPGSQAAVLARLRARLGGTVRIPYGVDLTEPTGEVWDAEIQ
jgi:hypothetical protein